MTFLYQVAVKISLELLRDFHFVRVRIEVTNMLLVLFELGINKYSDIGLVGASEYFLSM